MPVGIASIRNAAARPVSRGQRLPISLLQATGRLRYSGAGNCASQGRASRDCRALSARAGQAPARNAAQRFQGRLVASRDFVLGGRAFAERHLWKLPEQLDELNARLVNGAAETERGSGHLGRNGDEAGAMSPSNAVVRVRVDFVACPERGFAEQAFGNDVARAGKSVNLFAWRFRRQPAVASAPTAVRRHPLRRCGPSDLACDTIVREG